MITVQDIPQDWKDVLARVQGAFPGAIIAGGALRDLDHGKPVKDVDIFIPIDIIPQETLDGVIEDLGLQIHPIGKGRTNPDRKIFGIYHTTINGIQYELIFASPLACSIDTFDINICQIQFNGEAVGTTYQYDRGVQGKLITFPNPQSEKRMAERTERIQVKYPEYTIIKSAPRNCYNGY